MGHLHLIAAVDGPNEAFLLVDPHNLAEVGGPVAENREVLSDALLQKAENQAL